jgi:hypothetical protein
MSYALREFDARSRRDFVRIAQRFNAGLRGWKTT